MSHDYHEGLHGYHPDQIWHDGCAECEGRGAHVTYGVGTLDAERFRRAWKRAAQFNGVDCGAPDPHDTLSQCERPLLDLMWAMQLMLQRHCSVPIGMLP